MASTVARIESAANPNATQKARLKPSVSAGAASPLSATRLSVRVVATVVRIATPEGAADLLARVDQTRGETRLLR